ncbi:hypothetical protein LP52_14635 [Streptomonospora alba]|uniref:Uncharacterized protein n=1 Tax=Streptomonospora alba TaxID=183763 RepID=A0A0C2JH16_9ACTN|nr:hypothetical protein [Streptomonospora alba]KIH98165.1 hypothetical protein LP52_14635 [Streptomonospora alba]
MALWRWLGETARELRADGQAELAESLVRLAQMAAEGQADAAAEAQPAAERAARGESAPSWAAPLVGHWPLAARVGDRAEGQAALPAALTRLRASHVGGADGSAAGCTPAACSAEPVLACYANIDGPGHVVDRATLVAESLGHTRPGEPAWEALVLAQADMLIDDERPDEAVRELDARAAAARTGGSGVSLDYAFGYVRALRHLDRYDEALSALDRVEAGMAAAWPGGAPRAAARRRLDMERARLLAWLARSGRCAPQEARAALPEQREADAHPRLRPAWAEAAEHLVAAGGLDNDWRLGTALTAWSRYFERVGSDRLCLRVGLVAARLAVARGARWTADSALRRSERAVKRVRRAADEAADLDEIHTEAARRGPRELPVAASEVLPLLRGQSPEEVDPEHQADLVLAALQENPGDPALLNALGQVGRTLGLTDAAAELHWPRVHSAPGDQKAALSLLETLLADKDTAGLRALVRHLTGAALGSAPQPSGGAPDPAASPASAPVG